MNVLFNPREVGGELHADRGNLPQVSQDRWEKIVNILKRMMRRHVFETCGRLR